MSIKSAGSGKKKTLILNGLTSFIYFKDCEVLYLNKRVQELKKGDC